MWPAYTPETGLSELLIRAQRVSGTLQTLRGKLAALMLGWNRIIQQGRTPTKDQATPTLL